MPVKHLPDYILNRRGCVSLFNDPKTWRAYDDEKSIFRCIALHRRRQQVLDCSGQETVTESERASSLSAGLCYDEWLQFKHVSNSDAAAITLSDIPALESAFNINILVWRYVPPAKPPAPLTEAPMDATGEGVATDLSEVLVLQHEAAIAKAGIHKAQIVYSSRKPDRSLPTMNVNAYTDDSGAVHFSFISNLQTFCVNHVCETCGWCFERKSHLQRHQRNRKGECDKQEHLFPGNGAEVSPTLFERLDEIGICVDENRRYYPFFSVFDCESCCDHSASNIFPLAPFTSKSRYNFTTDPEAVPSDVTGVLRYNWKRLRSHIAADFSFAVMRSPAKLPQLRSLARLLAQNQRNWFDLNVKVLKCNGCKVTESNVASWKYVRSESDLDRAEAEIFTRALLSKQLSKALAVRIEVTPSLIPDSTKSELHLLSIAIASNVPGEQSQFLCRTNDDEEEAELVHNFVDELHRIQAKTEELMTQSFQPELDELDKRLEQHRLEIFSLFTDRLEVLLGEIRALGSALSNTKLDLLVEGLRDGDNGPAETQQKIVEMEKRLCALRKSSKLVMQMDEAYTSCAFEKFRVKDDWYAAMGPKSMSDFKFYHNQRKQAAKLRRDLKQYCAILPVFGFNSGRFDLDLLRQWLFPYLQEFQKDVSIRPLKKGRKYLQVTTERLRFLDICNYLGPCTSYADWIKAYADSSEKGILCYEYLKRPSVLLETSLPPREAFNNKLKGFTCSVEQYSAIQQAWQENNMQTLCDYLRYYNLLDVGPFVIAVEKMMAFWRIEKHDMLNNVCTLPGLADRFVRKNFLPKHTNLVLPQRVVKNDNATCAVDNSDLYYTMKRSIVGGPSCVYHRLHIAGETKLRGGPEMCRSIVGLDCNGLYLDSSQKDMPTQVPVRYWKAKPDDEFFQRRSLYPNWQAQTQWLEWKAHELNANIKHQFNSAKPPRVGGQQPDGYDAATKTAFFLDGCRFHGHGNCIANPNSQFPLDLDPWKKRQKDFAIRRCLRERGYNVVEIKECEWMQLKRDNKRASQLNPDFVAPKRLGKEFKPPKGSPDSEYDYDPTLRQFLNEHFSLPKHGRMTENKLLAEIRRGRFFGIIVCDVNVPEHLRAFFADFEPIFKNVEVGPEHLDKLMAEHLKRTVKGSKPRRMLVNSFFAKDFVLTTPLAMWYLEHHLEITNITGAYEWKPKAIYEKFADRVSYHRRRADAFPAEKILGDEWKLRGNSIYGKTLTTIEKHTDTRICNSHKSTLLQRNVHKFVKAEPFGTADSKWFEVTERKAKVTHNLYNPFGAFVYQYSKLRMLEMYYDFFVYYWEHKDFQLMYVDTDSFYLALSTTNMKSFKQAVRPDRAAEFALDWNNYLAFEKAEATNEQERKWAAFDKRKVGLFKVEETAEKMCALAPKTYGCASGKGELTKFSAKGVSRCQNNLTWESFYEVLTSKQPLQGTSITLTRPRNNDRICQVESPKRLLSYDFYKRKLGEDGITTFPLGL